MNVTCNLINKELTDGIKLQGFMSSFIDFFLANPFSNPWNADWLFLPKDKGRGPPMDLQWWWWGG